MWVLTSIAYYSVSQHRRPLRCSPNIANSPALATFFRYPAGYSCVSRGLAFGRWAGAFHAMLSKKKYSRRELKRRTPRVFRWRVSSSDFWTTDAGSSTFSRLLMWVGHGRRLVSPVLPNCKSHWYLAPHTLYKNHHLPHQAKDIEDDAHKNVPGGAND